MEEEWKDILEFPGYRISNFGNVYSMKSNRLLKLALDTKGYLTCGLYHNGKGNTKAVHRLVALYFLPPMEGMVEVNPKDGDPTNSHVSNLEWSDRSSNMKHARDTGLQKSKLTRKEVDEIRTLYKPRSKEFGQKALAQMFGVSHQQISKIIRNERWVY